MFIRFVSHNIFAKTKNKSRNFPSTMFRIALIFSVTILSCLTREAPKLKFHVPQRKPIPSPISYNFEALVTIENAGKTLANGEQDSYEVSPPISSYNEPTSLQWYLRFYPKDRSGSIYQQDLIFKVVPYVKNIPIGVKDVSVKSGQLKMDKKEYYGGNIKRFSPRNILSNGKEIPREIRLEDFAYEGTFGNVNSNLTFYFEAEITYIYGKTTSNEGENTYAALAQAAIEELNLFQNGRLESDVSLTGGNKRMTCHQDVLMKRSPLMRRAFQNAAFDGTLDLSGQINGDELEDLVRFLYTGKAKNLGVTCYKLYPLAKQYGIEELMKKCETVLIFLIDSENAAELFGYGQQEGATELMKAAARQVANT